MTTILGLSAFYHDSAAALVVDGQIVAAAQEERFTRKKHDADFPSHAIAYCLAEAGIDAQHLDFVGFYDKPLLKFDRLLETYLAFAPVGFQSFTKAMPVWLRQKLHIGREIRKGLGGKYTKRIVFSEHHESHAASAFFPSPYDEAAILTIDGVGEWATASVGVGRGHEIELLQELRFPHSVGLLYSAMTYFCGFKVNFGEYKLMGLAPYGEPKYVDLILEKLLDLKPDGSLRLDLTYFRYCQGLTMTSPKMSRLFGRPPRSPEGPLTQDDMDIAASIQKVTEEIMLRMARHARQRTGMRNLCLAGGVALNCVGNGRIVREGIFDSIWIQPAAGDAGGALGVALLIWHQALGHGRTSNKTDSQSGTLLGPTWTSDEIRALLDAKSAIYHEVKDEASLLDQLAADLDAGSVVGFFQGRMEFGPRALGSRSILGDPRDAATQEVMNLKIKFRESFRPFAPSVLGSRATEIFELPPDVESPYMLLVAPVREAYRLPITDSDATGLARLKIKRSTLPAITHVDYSARIQTVDAARHGRYHRLLTAFESRTGCPLLVNTSFNVRGEPIVCSPADALRCFLGTDMDVLALGDFRLVKSEQPEVHVRAARSHAASFEAD